MEEKKKMLLDWMRKIHQLEYAHCYQSIYFGKIEKIIGISAFLISTLVAFSYRFPDVENEFFNEYLFFLKKDYLIPFLAFVVAILTGLQTFLKPNEKADVHRKLGLDYEKIRHTIEKTLTKNDSLTIDDDVKKIDEEWKSFNTLYVRPKYFEQAKTKVRNFKKYPEELGFLPTIEKNNEYYNCR